MPKKMQRILDGMFETEPLAELRLALLKENFHYRELYLRLKENLIKSTEKLYPEPGGAWPGYYLSEFLRSFDFFLNAFCMAHKHCPIEEILEALEPGKNIRELKLTCSPTKILQRLFRKTGIIMIEPDTRRFSDSPHTNFVNLISPHPEAISPKDFFTQLKPHERVLKVDLRTRKKFLMRDFERFLEYIEFSRKNLPERFFSYGLWKQDKTRQREAWIQLGIWKKRREKLSFREIARQGKIGEDLAKKHFYRAYELTQGKKYDPEKFNRQNAILITEIKKTCATCPERGTCSSLCPDVMPFVDQDHVRQKEKFPSW